MSIVINGYTLEPYADLTNADLGGADLSNADLTGINFTGASLRAFLT